MIPIPEPLDTQNLDHRCYVISTRPHFSVGSDFITHRTGEHNKMVVILPQLGVT